MILARRTATLRRLAAAVLAASAGGTVLGAVPAAAAPVLGATGLVQQVIVELPHGRDDRQTLLVDGTSAVREVTGLESVPTGSRVQATLGARTVSGDRPVRSFSVVAAPRRTAAAAASYAAKPVVVVPITWPGGPKLDKTGAQVADVVAKDTNSYWQEASGGRIGFTTSKVLAPVTLSKSFCSADGGVNQAVLKEVYDAAGITPGAENGRHLLAYAPKDTACGWAGMATISNNDPGYGGWVVVNGLARLDVIGHELGHNVGLGHSNLRWCNANGVRSSDAATGCTVEGYRDPYDIMGIAWGTSGRLNAAQRDQLGLLSPGGSTDVTSGDVTLAPLGGGSGLRAARVADGTARYWLEYRTATGRDGWVDGSSNTDWYAKPGSGVVVHRADTLRAGNGTQLIDGHPVGTKLDRAALRAGERWTSPSGKLIVTVVSASASGAVVRVTGGPSGPFSLTGAPSAPSAAQDAVQRTGSVNLTWTASADTGNGVARYDVLAGKTVIGTAAGDATAATVTVPTGRQTVTVRAVDALGQTRTSSNSVRYLIDPDAPVVSAPRIAFRAGTVGADLPVTARWTATDSLSGVCGQEFTGTGGRRTLNGSTRSATDTSRPGAANWDVTATDCAGNVTTVGGSATTALVQDDRLRYSSGWTTGRSSAASGGTLRATRTSGASTTQTVTARALALVATRSTTQGSLGVYVDGKLAATVNLYASKAATRQVVWTTDWAAAGKHTVKVVNLGTKGRPSVNVDALLTLA